MTAEIFRKVVAENGDVSYEPVEVEQLDEVVQLNDKLEAVKKEAIDRRHKLKELQQKTENPATPTEPTTTVTPPVSPDEIVDKAVVKLEERAQRQREAERLRQEEVQKIVTEFGLTAEDGVKLSRFDPAQARVAAEMLAVERKRFDQTPAGGNGGAVEMSTIMSRAEEKLFGKRKNEG